METLIHEFSWCSDGRVYTHTHTYKQIHVRTETPFSFSFEVCFLISPLFSIIDVKRLNRSGTINSSFWNFRQGGSSYSSAIGALRPWGTADRLSIPSKLFHGTRFLEPPCMPCSPFSQYKLCIQNWWESFTKGFHGIYIRFSLWSYHKNSSHLFYHSESKITFFSLLVKLRGLTFVLHNRFLNLTFLDPFVMWRIIECFGRTHTSYYKLPCVTITAFKSLS